MINGIFKRHSLPRRWTANRNRVRAICELSLLFVGMGHPQRQLRRDMQPFFSYFHDEDHARMAIN